MMWDGDFGMGGGWIVGSIMMIVVLALIAVGIVLLIRGVSGRQGDESAGGGQASSSQTPEPGSALRILEERYARGEIDQEEFLRRKKDLLGE